MAENDRIAELSGVGLSALLGRFESLRDNAYIEYIGCCRKDDCLGWEAKVEHGEFGLDELEAHKRAAEWLGKHRAYARVVDELRTVNR